jgi:geranylgeranyl pyrophosphate synthase
MLHTATLVHDDLIDESKTRRGRAALQVEAGADVALLVGDLYLARCGVHLSEVGDPRATRELFGALATIVRGELEQRRRRFDLEQTEADYFDTIARKTASLLEAACASAVLVSGGDDALHDQARRYGHHCGVAFQIIDDVLDYTATDAQLGKPAGHDIGEGTVTLPLILAASTSPDVVAELVQSARASGDFGAVISNVRSSGSLERCETLASEHAGAAVRSLDGFPDTAEREQLADLARELVARRR